ncbi:hypothetical protein [Gordonia sp. SL306]|nr:hypothetical protein [Gordonia sp. SL306]WAC55687.1 hypothetical protein OVA31_24510 [Gordonia sp. SL306]
MGTFRVTGKIRVTGRVRVSGLDRLRRRRAAKDPSPSAARDPRSAT